MSAIAGLADLALLGILLSGLALSVAWLTAAIGWWRQRCRRWLQGTPEPCARPIAVFVFENFAADPGSSGVVGRRDEQPDAEGELLDEEPLDGGGARERRAAALAGYDIDVLESDGELMDGDTRDRVEDVLLEYTSVMEANSESELRNRRLKYFNCLVRGDEESEADSESDDSANPAPRLPPSPPPPPLPPPPPPQPPTEVGERLRLRLKYFNDEQRLVTASSAESVAEFKRRHFQSELAANRRVRLIHNGRELPDGLTLGGCGLQGDAAVHCLITEAPPPSVEPPATAADEAATGTVRSGDIGALAYPLLCLLLCLMWYCRAKYTVYFNFASTFALAWVTLATCAGVIAAVCGAISGGGGGGGGWGGGQVRVHRINLSERNNSD